MYARAGFLLLYIATFVPRTIEILCVYIHTLPLENLKLQTVCVGMWKRNHFDFTCLFVCLFLNNSNRPKYCFFHLSYYHHLNSPLVCATETLFISSALKYRDQMEWILKWLLQPSQPTTGGWSAHLVTFC